MVRLNPDRPVGEPIVFTAALVVLTILFINVHGFKLSGTAAITRADDPFWHVRAFDNALSRHYGDRLTSFICAINPLVMHEIAGAATSMTNRMADPTLPGSSGP